MPQSRAFQTGLKGVTNILQNTVFTCSFISFYKEDRESIVQPPTSIPLEEQRRDTYLDLKLEVLIFSLPTEDIAWNTNLNWVLEVIWICSQRAGNHSLSKEHQIERTKRNQNHSAANTLLEQEEKMCFKQRKEHQTSRIYLEK